MEWMMMPLRRYADFEGRSRRMEYWMFQLGQMLIYTVAIFIFGLLGMVVAQGSEELGGMIMILPLFVILLGLFIPSLAVTVRRLHDQDKSGWWILINFVPFGGIVLIIFMFLEGTPGPNQYGPDPKGVGEAETFS